MSDFEDLSIFEVCNIFVAGFKCVGRSLNFSFEGKS